MDELRRGRLPREVSRPINHIVLTGTLGGEPQIARGPTGDPVTLLTVEFSVADPARPQMLWNLASCLVEVPFDRAVRDLEVLRGGDSVLAAGQISERWMIEGGHTSRRGVVVASLLKQGPSPTRLELPR